MTAEKIIEVCNVYRRRFSTNSNGLGNPRISHVYNRMIPLTIEFAEAGRIEKAFRWLGFMQGVLWAEGFYTIEELKGHNKP